MKKLLLVFLVIFFISVLWAEDWKIDSSMALTMNQQAYSENWNGEERGAISWIFNADFLAEKQLIPTVHNKNSLKIAFGQTHNQEIDANGEKYWKKPDKSTDKIDFESMFRFTFGAFVDPFVSGRLESQFIDESGLENEIFNPNITTEAMGMAKVFMKTEKKELSSRLGGAFKQYFNKNIEKSSNDGGLEFVAEYKAPLTNEIAYYSTSMNLYKPLFYSESDDMLNDDWEMVRMDWQNNIDIKLTSLINVKMYFQLLYNKLEDKDMQFKETLGIGLSYTLF